MMGMPDLQYSDKSSIKWSHIFQAVIFDYSIYGASAVFFRGRRNKKWTGVDEGIEAG